MEDRVVERGAGARLSSCWSVLWVLTAASACRLGYETACPPGAIVCEDFEAEPDEAWSIHTVDALVDLGPAHHGATALRVRRTDDGGTGGHGFAEHRFDPDAVASEQQLSLSGWVHLPADLDVQRWLVLYAIQGFEPDGGEQFPKLSIDIHSGNRLAITSTMDQTSWQAEPGSVPLGDWTCLELRVEVGDAGRATLHADGAMVVDTGPGVTTRPPGGYEATWLGVWADDAQGWSEIRHDDFALIRGPGRCGS